jgi:acetylglutamate/LysW-gamma-L-alpha-aminoadipate kinase
MTMENLLVVKLGGGAGLDMDAALRDLSRVAIERPLVIVHGVSERMGQLCAERGIPVETLTSPAGHTSRYTPPAVRDVFVEAATQINTEIVAALRQNGVVAAGLTELIVINGQRKTAIRAVSNGRMRIVRDDYTGSITGIDATPILAALNRGEVPVIPPLAISDDGPLNIDGDRAAAAVASAIQAAEVIILSNVRGLYRNFPDEASFVPAVPQSRLEEAMNWAQGRMKRKVLSAQEALAGGIPRVIIGDGRTATPITHALQGEGTVFTA